MIKIYNTFSQKKEPINLGQKVGIYACGITPYDTTHVGHAFTFITYDVLIRYLRFLGKKVTYVQNVTDIDDDILIKAKSLKINWQKLGVGETQKHLKNMDKLNLLRPDYYPKATKHITQMIKIIGVLVKKDLAYIKNGSVYFDIASDNNFGKLSKFNYNAMLEIASERGNYPLDPNKKDPLDFILWQKSKLNEPFWNSPWGKGRPGWHIECSAMSMKYLGPSITIHGGGTDLIFPHHEAEIAQSENYTSKKFVKIWMHTAMVYIDGKKMSKSLGNMIFISDLIKKFDPNTIRLFMLLHHWRSPWNYQVKDFEKADKFARIIKNFVGKLNTLTVKQVKKLIPDFFEALDNDFDTPAAIQILVNFANTAKGRNYQEVVYKCAGILGLAI